MKSLILFFLLLPLTANAYIPDYKMIMSRVAENHGRGYYKIIQDVIFPGSPDPLVIEETWITSGEEDLSVTLRGKGLLKNQVTGTIVYKNGKRYFRNSGIKAAKMSADFLEPIFHFRYSKNIKPKLVAMKITPASSLQPRPQFTGEDTKGFPQQNFIRLARTGGFVAYAIGDPTPINQAEENPGIWIEQDRFNIRKIRTISSATVVASNYNRYPGKLLFPKTRQYSWENHSAQALVSSINSLPRNSKTTSLLDPNILKEADAEKTLALPENEMIRDFYKRFR